MNQLTVIRTLAIFSIIGGLFRALMLPLSIVWGPDNPIELTSGILGTLFMGIGLFGIYFYHAKGLGKLGFTGFILHAISCFLLMGMVFSTFVIKLGAPEILEMDMPPLPIMVAGPLMMVTLILSMIMLGIAILKTKVMSQIPAILLIVSPFLNFIPIPAISGISIIAWGIPFMWFGFEVFKAAEKKNVSLKNLELPVE